MKAQVLWLVLLFSSSALFWSGCASSQGSGSRFQSDARTGSGQASIQAVSGTVQYSMDGAEWRTATPGMQINEGDRLRTGPNAEARVNLGEQRGGLVRILPNSVVIFEQLFPSTDAAEVGIILNLPQGRVVGDTARTPQGQKILVKTPNGMHEVTADGR